MPQELNQGFSAVNIPPGFYKALDDGERRKHVVGYLLCQAVEALMPGLTLLAVRGRCRDLSQPACREAANVAASLSGASPGLPRPQAFGFRLLPVWQFDSWVLFWSPDSKKGEP